MKTTFIKSIIRNCLKGNRSAIINFIGLSFGFAVLMAIIFYIREELNHDQFHEKLDNIYSVFTKDHNTHNDIGYNESVPAMANALRTEFPEVEDAALYYGGTLRFLVDYNGQSIYEQVQLADANLFNIFSFPILKGKLPDNPNETSVVAISNKMATKYFANENPVGKTLKINNNELYTVAAVFENIPKNSSVKFDFWFPIKLLEKEDADALKIWSNLSFRCYALLNSNASIPDINKKLHGRIQQSNPDSTERSQLYPFKDMYLKAWGNSKNIRMMLIIASVILTLVCLNFINLQIAESFQRIQTFGIKRINGAGNFAIIMQLVGEALFYCFTAAIVAVGITHLASDFLLNLLGKSNVGAQLISTQSLLIIGGIAVVIAILSGVAPALIINKVSPTNAIKNKVSDHVGAKKLRVVFTSLQFSMAITLVICLLTINNQLSFLRNKNLGFNKDQIVFVHIEGKLKDKADIFREELTKHTAIESATLASRSPIGIYWNGGGWDWENKPADFNPMVSYIETDKHFQETFAIEMKEGSYVNNDVVGVVINETFAKMIDSEQSVLGKTLMQTDENLEIPVVGIIKDIHFKSLKRRISPLMIIPQMGFDEIRYIFIKLSPKNIDEGLAIIHKTVNEINPGFPCEHFFLDQDFKRLYNSEEKLRNQIMFFSILAIIISCMGLWGILMFIVKQRIKEIGIRKVNGAKITEILTMLNKDFIKWVAIAFVLACPIAYYAMNKWLENFAYKTTLSWWIFALAGVLALGIALLTVSWQSWRAATRNPVEALRYE